MKAKIIVLTLAFFLICSCFNLLFAAEKTNGYLRLILNEVSGRYSLFYMSNPNTSRYEALFSSEDPNTSYASVLLDGKVYRLGGKFFTNKFEKRDGLPVFIFESEFLTVTQVFTPVKSANSKYVNGVMITYTIQNLGSEENAIGFRILIDTALGEKAKNIFLTGERVVKNETLIEGHAGERFWVSRGKSSSLMGSIINPVDTSARVPDYIHFANWKRLNDAPWKLKYVKRRSFDNAPFSVNDSAVCYYFDPELLSPGNQFTYSIVLSTEDVEWYNSLNVSAQAPAAPAKAPARTAAAVPARAAAPVSAAPAVQPSVPKTEAPPEEIITPTISIKQIELDAHVEASENKEDVNELTLKKFQEILNQFVAGEIKLNEKDIIELENAIDRYR